MRLNEDDPFERAVAEMVKMNRKKRADYSHGDDPFSNFRETAASLGLKDFNALDSVLFNVLQKVARLKALRTNGRTPQNESVMDTYLDLAVYSAILYAMALSDQEAMREFKLESMWNADEQEVNIPQCTCGNHVRKQKHDSQCPVWAGGEPYDGGGVPTASTKREQEMDRGFSTDV